MTEAEQLKQKFTQWSEYLGVCRVEPDSNSIAGLLYALYWEMGAYRAYEAICKSNPANPLSAPLFRRLTSFNYIQIQALRIRRLCDNSPADFKEGEKDKSVYSLSRLVHEIKQEQKHKRFTKSNVCAVFGIPLSGDFSISSVQAGHIHLMLDKVCDENGLLAKNIIDQLDKCVQGNKNAELKSIIDFVDKYISHSSSQSSRDQAEANNLQLHMVAVNKVIAELTEAFYICNMLIAYNEQNLIPVNLDGQLTGLSHTEQEVVHVTYQNLRQEVDIIKKNAYKLIGVPA